MTRSQFDTIFAEVGAQPIREAVVRALRSGVEAAGQSYQFGAPRTDGYTYGNDLWRFVWHDMGYELKKLPGGASVQRPRGSFLVDLGAAVLYPFRYGADRSADVTTYRMTESQFRRELLVDPSTAEHLFWPEVVLVPYAANAGAGLVRAYVGGARINEDDRLNWQWLEELDLGGPPSGGRRDGSPDRPVVPPFAAHPEPELNLSLTDEGKEDVDG